MVNMIIYHVCCCVLYDSVCIGLLNRRFVCMSGMVRYVCHFTSLSQGRGSSTEETIVVFLESFLTNTLDVMLLNLLSFQDNLCVK